MKNFEFIIINLPVNVPRCLTAFIHNKQKRQRVAACTPIYIDSLGIRCLLYRGQHIFYSGAFRRLLFSLCFLLVVEAKKSFDFFFLLNFPFFVCLVCQRMVNRREQREEAKKKHGRNFCVVLSVDGICLHLTLALARLGSEVFSSVRHERHRFILLFFCSSSVKSKLRLFTQNTWHKHWKHYSCLYLLIVLYII